MKSVAVIGAGIAGLVCARELRRSGHRVQVFDKGLSLGGRTASRRQWGTLFNHGAPWFEVRDPEFMAELEEALGAGALRQLNPELVQLDGNRPVKYLDNRWIFAGWPTMNRFAYHLAADIPVSSGFAVTRLCRRAMAHGPHGWEVHRQGAGSAGTFDAVVLALPAPQTTALLPLNHPLRELVAGVEMAPVLTAMAVPEQPLSLSWDGAEFTAGPLRRAIRQRTFSTQPGDATPRETESLILHATHSWSKEHLENEPMESARLLVRAFAETVGPLPELRHLGGHRWRFARATAPLGSDYLLDGNLNLGVCGDWCRGPRLEDAWASGRALARQLLDDLGVVYHPGGQPVWGQVH